MNKCKLGELAISQTGPFGSQLHENDYVEKGIPIVTVEHLGDNGFTTQNLPFVSETDAERLNKYMLKEGDIVFSRVGSIDRCVYVKKEQEGWLFSGRCLRVRCDNEKVNSRYLAYYFKLPKFKKMMLNISVGATMPSLNTDLMNSIQLMLLERNKQDQIATLLDTLDSKIKNNTEINVELESIEKTIYDYWFLQFDFPDENGKPYKSSGGKMVWNEALKKEIPEGWEVKKIQNILTKIPTTKKYKLDEYGKGNKYPIIDQSSKYICGYTDDENELLNLEDCIVFGDHTKCVKYVNFAFARGADGTQIINSSISNLPNYILYRQILDMDLVSQGYSRYFKFLKDKYVIVPQKSVSDRFMEGINGSLSKMKHIINENRELESLRNYLLPLLMNGQVGFK